MVLNEDGEEEGYDLRQPSSESVNKQEPQPKIEVVRHDSLSTAQTDNSGGSASTPSVHETIPSVNETEPRQVDPTVFQRRILDDHVIMPVTNAHSLLTLSQVIGKSSLPTVCLSSLQLAIVQSAASLLLRLNDAFLDEHLAQRPVFVLREQDVAAADELSVHVELRNRRPRSARVSMCAQLERTSTP